MADMTYATSYVREAPEIEAFKLGLLSEAQRLYQDPLYLPAMEAAGMSLGEQQAMDFARQGVGAFEPYIQAGSQGVEQGMDLTQRGAQAAGAIDTASQYQAAQNMLQKGMPTLTAGIGGIKGAARSYDPTSASAYMNPYQQGVTQEALKEMRRQADIGSQKQAAGAVQAGAFGGTREGVQRAEYERGVQDLMSQRIMQDYANNYQQAQAASQQAFESQQARQLAGGQALGQAAMQYADIGKGIGALTASQAEGDIAKSQALGSLGSQMGSLGGLYGSLGQTTQQLGAADAGLLAGLGGLERQIAQSQLDAIRQTQTQEAMQPFQRLGFVSDIYRGAPTTQMALTAESAPTASPMQTALGLGVGTLATAAGAKTAGLF
mgnify:CR=1 FL=1|jgi:hypothetical protein